MHRPVSIAHPRLLFLVAFGVWLALFVGLATRPAISLPDARGLYAVERAGYQWTSNRVSAHIQAHSGPTEVKLVLGDSSWPGRQVPHVTLTSDNRPLASFIAPVQIRTYHFVVPARSQSLLLETSVDRPPQHDSRWLGVRLLDLTARPSGFPWQAAGQALLLALCSIPLALLAVWITHGGYGLPGALTGLALLLRVAWLRESPPGFNQDEVVSAVDAWYLSRTFRDHLGNALPLGAQEAFGDWISPLLTYLELPLVAILGPTPGAARLVTAVAGALAVPAGYVLAHSLRLGSVAAACVALVVAVSPWQIFLSRFAIPPALVPLCWTLCLLAGVVLIQHGQRRDAGWLALTAGFGIYAYPTMKLVIPLLVGLAVLLASFSHGWRAALRWVPAALLLGLLWLPLAVVTVFNPASATRLNQALLRAGSVSEWVAQWWTGYIAHMRPAFLYVYGDGDPIHSFPGHGVQLWAEAPLLVLGLVALAWHCRRGRRRPQLTSRRSPHCEWWLIAGALLMAPLPASLTQASAHATRGATIAPLYALLIGIGWQVVWQATGLINRVRPRTLTRRALSSLFAAALIGQALPWFRDYVEVYPATVASAYQDGLLETMERAIQYAPDFDEVWIDTDGVAEPQVYLLAAQPMPPGETQALLQVTRRPQRFNVVTAIGRYHFGNLTAIPSDLPTLEAVTDRTGGPAFVIQEWRTDKRILLVRRMK